MLTRNKADADDLAQQACLRAMEKMELYDGQGSFKSWIMTIARRLWLNEVRATKVRTGNGRIDIVDVEIEDENLGPETNILGREVLESIMALADGQREAVLLVYAEGHKYREAADILDVPVGTVMSRLAAARASLAKTFELKGQKKNDH